MLKRIFDISFSVTVLLLIFPAFLLVAVIIYAYDRGPIFYRQQRIGVRGKPFGILKFRSMVRNADKLGGYSTAENDPRITPVGKFIRRTSIDELPQLINVLFGEMSIVGPRPDVPEQRYIYSDQEWAQRNSVRPGLTGLAQATSRSMCTEDERKSLDLQYVRNASFLFDLKIIFMTVKQVLVKGGN